LVAIDLNKQLLDQTLVKREGFGFFVELQCERLPAFCYHFVKGCDQGRAEDYRLKLTGLIHS